MVVDARGERVCPGEPRGGWILVLRGAARRGACANTDNSTAAASLAGLVDFFQNKFPKLAANPFYVTGESYAGVYVPTLSRAILDHNDAGGFPIPLAGLAAGDPCTDNDFQRDSMDMLWYGHKHGFVAEADFDLLWNKVRRSGTPARKAAGGGRETRDGLRGGARRKTPRARRRRGPPRPPRSVTAVRRSRTPTPECVAARRRFLLATSDAFSQEWRHAWLNDLSLYGPSAVVRDDVPGTLDFDMSTWMARADVRAALHVEDAPADVWPGPSDDWSYESQWGACNDAAPPGTPSMVDFYRYLAPRLRRTIVFNGDTDPCVSYEGTRAADDDRPRRTETRRRRAAAVLRQRHGGPPRAARREAPLVRTVARGCAARAGSLEGTSRTGAHGSRS